MSALVRERACVCLHVFVRACVRACVGEREHVRAGAHADAALQCYTLAYTLI